MTTTAGATAHDTADDLDTGRADVRPALRRLGEVGAFGADDDDPTEALLVSVRMLRQLAAVSLATAFAAWSQRMVLEYLRCCPPPPPLDGLAAQLRAGTVPGATALAPAVADLAGTGTLPLTAVRDGAGWRLSGTVGWASNLFDDAVVVTPARTADEGRVVVLFRRTDPGVTPTGPHDTLGLRGTGTGGLHLDGLAVGPEQVLSDDLTAFMAVCRPAMLLLQTALALGLADAALAAAQEHLPAVLRADGDALAERRDDLARRLEDLAGDRVGVGPGDLARLRLAALDVAAEAVRLETAVAGGAGYLAGSATARRVREVAFLPVQAPTYGQLRREISAAGPRQ
ncbi:alkylation response protein AidB-like acyl-CoA dehydrogenase [Geodermatophilus tzadiensis]|uniref:Alkylation response protein AidB-like acyl-CoA dehydrogenase n=1 Tax=Geodermatophilus tzadiensis TaxID=1137988 RepID=A0A2T0TZN8_9ACTN|nr:acyl-CoA/acyl-ACP dehydrogenase [Geodermatophilus tzadiensis]PRY51124.1 alkylation response protein AidB-like acyl-CoA dehydrogenase [Geodermatophilus tzadiensis]